MLSTSPPSVEVPKSETSQTIQGDQYIWARLVLQLHHHGLTGRRVRFRGRRTCTQGSDPELWAAPHGCATRVRALKVFFHHATPAELDAALLAGLITRAEARSGVQPVKAPKPRCSWLRRRARNRANEAPPQPVPYPLEAVGIS
jgi:hypothetical protein